MQSAEEQILAWLELLGKIDNVGIVHRDQLL